MPNNAVNFTGDDKHRRTTGAVGNTIQMRRPAILVLTLVLAATSVLSEDIKTYHESATPKALSQWCKADDEKVSVCLIADKTTFGTNELLTLRCAVRNNTDKPITILRPFGDTFYAHSTGLSILGPDGAVSYRGPMKEYVLGTLSFVELSPHTVAEETLGLPRDIFPGLGKPGLYVIGYVFLSDGYPKQSSAQNFWQGKVTTTPVAILMK